MVDRVWHDPGVPVARGPEGRSLIRACYAIAAATLPDPHYTDPESGQRRDLDAEHFAQLVDRAQHLLGVSVAARYEDLRPGALTPASGPRPGSRAPPTDSAQAEGRRRAASRTGAHRVLAARRLCRLPGLW